ncbi:hypothetical protein J6590_102759, partial [Homalodisca vitripennis]
MRNQQSPLPPSPLRPQRSITSPSRLLRSLTPQGRSLTPTRSVVDLGLQGHAMTLTLAFKVTR